MDVVIALRRPTRMARESVRSFAALSSSTIVAVTAGLALPGCDPVEPPDPSVSEVWERVVDMERPVVVPGDGGVYFVDGDRRLAFVRGAASPTVVPTRAAPDGLFAARAGVFVVSAGAASVVRDGAAVPLVAGLPGTLLDVDANGGFAFASVGAQLFRRPRFGPELWSPVAEGVGGAIDAEGSSVVWGDEVSVDSGATFFQTDGVHFLELFRCPTTPDTLYGATADDVRRSDDGGLTWRTVFDRSATQLIVNDGCDEVFFVSERALRRTVDAFVSHDELHAFEGAACVAFDSNEGIAFVDGETLFATVGNTFVAQAQVPGTCLAATAFQHRFFFLSSSDGLLELGGNGTIVRHDEEPRPLRTARLRTVEEQTALLKETESADELRSLVVDDLSGPSGGARDLLLFGPSLVTAVAGDEPLALLEDSLLWTSSAGDGAFTFTGQSGVDRIVGVAGRTYFSGSRIGVGVVRSDGTIEDSGASGAVFGNPASDVAWALSDTSLSRAEAGAAFAEQGALAATPDAVAVDAKGDLFFVTEDGVLVGAEGPLSDAACGTIAALAVDDDGVAWAAARCGDLVLLRTGTRHAPRQQ